MRCPKCGYISFDHMETCLKCKKDISGSTDVEGTTYHAIPPSFLQVPKKNDPVEDETSSVESSVEVTEDFTEDKYDFSDPDLDVFLDDDDITIEETGEDEKSIGFADPDSADFQLEADDEEDDEEIDFDFELDGDDDLGFSDDEQRTPPTLNISDELADISDLAPPVQKEVPVVSDANEMSLSLDEDLDLDVLDLDLDLGFGADSNDGDAELALSLDDIDLSAGDTAKGSSALDGLSLDLDLDGLDLSPVAEKEKSPGSLDGISLSLD
ncbi:MAG: hypothetical protein U9R57_08715 [Thermodesulfobacteriota bacterium]|nr:hypothetical protein [Thermodesulfobacteriota bacterium]